MNVPAVLADRFEVQGPIGQGGMGVVLRGLDRQTRHAVAIKTLRADVAVRDPLALLRFQREAEMLRQLNHPNIIKVLATIEQDAATYIVMEYAEGGSLAPTLGRHNPLPLDRVLSLALDVADAMTRVHRLGILHRDLKPENILLTEDGSARLSDFGIAYLTGANALTQEAGVFGTTHYLSPEALKGEPLDTRTDVWSFGAVLFEMLAGRPPFAGPFLASIVHSIISDPLPDLEALRPDAPIALIDLIYRMLEKDVSARLRSVRLVGAELEALLHAGDQGQTVLRTAFGAESRTERHASLRPGSTPSVKSTPHNLPAQTTSFVGRQREMQELTELIGDPGVRLITIVGAGGSGKTRVAQELGAQVLATFPDGVFFVPLAPLREADRIVTTIGDAIGLAFAPGVPHQQQLLAYLSERRQMLILDNFEHLLQGGGLAAEILNSAAQVAIVVTSRERLGLQDETVFRLEGIDVPAPHAPAETLASCGSVELFLQSARRASLRFVPTNRDLAAIGTICRTVGGSPLAILLAASWAETLSPPDILQEILRNLDFLETDLRHVERRHRSMRVVFDAAWDRLSEEERTAFASMAVFRGGFARDAAQEVTGASLRVLSTLVRQSLLYRDSASGRYDMHELLRQYAEERLRDDSVAYDRASRSHALHYSMLLQRMEGLLYGPGKGRALAEIEGELDNIRAAWDCAVEHREVALIGRSLASLATFYGMHTLNEEAVARFGAGLDVVRALPDSQRPLELELGLHVRWTVAVMNLRGYGDPDVGAGFNRAHALCEQLGPSRLLAPVMFGLWAFYTISAEHQKAERLAAQLLEIGETSNDSILAIGGHHASAGSAAAMGRFEESVRHAEHVLRLYRPDFDPLIITFFADHSASASRGWLVASLIAMGELDRARRVSSEMRAFFEQLGHGQTHAQGLMFQFLHAYVERDGAAAEKLSLELRGVGERYGLPVYTAFGDCYLAIVTATPATLVGLAQSAGAIRDVFGFKAMTIRISTMREAELLLASGDATSALAKANESLDWIRAHQEHYFESDAHCLRGDVLRAMGDDSAAEDSYRAAIRVAQSQKAKLFELRATMALCRLWQQQGRKTEAEAILTPVYGWFSEGADSIDLREATSLHDAIRQSA